MYVYYNNLLIYIKIVLYRIAANLVISVVLFDAYSNPFINSRPAISKLGIIIGIPPFVWDLEDVTKCSQF